MEPEFFKMLYKKQLWKMKVAYEKTGFLSDSDDECEGESIFDNPDFRILDHRRCPFENTILELPDLPALGEYHRSEFSCCFS